MAMVRLSYNRSWQTTQLHQFRVIRDPIGDHRGCAIRMGGFKTSVARYFVRGATSEGTSQIEHRIKSLEAPRRKSIGASLRPIDVFFYKPLA